MSSKKWRNSCKRFVVILTLQAFVMTNIGLAIFTHSCSISGVQKSLFVQGEDPCIDEHLEETTSCCQSSDLHELHLDKSCCNTQTNYLALGIDTRIEHSNLKFDLIHLPVCYPVESLHLILNKQIESTTNRHHLFQDPPPKLQGRDFQSIHQVYVI